MPRRCRVCNPTNVHHHLSRAHGGFCERTQSPSGNLFHGLRRFGCRWRDALAIGQWLPISTMAVAALIGRAGQHVAQRFARPYLHVAALRDQRRMAERCLDKARVHAPVHRSGDVGVPQPVRVAGDQGWPALPGTLSRQALGIHQAPIIPLQSGSDERDRLQSRPPSTKKSKPETGLALVESKKLSRIPAQDGSGDSALCSRWCMSWPEMG